MCDRYNSQWYYYDNNGNMTARWTSTGWQTMSWDHENRLSGVSGASLPTESYLYDTDGQRVRKTSNGVNTYYPNQYYEQSGSTITKYHYFNGQHVSMHTNASGGWLHYDLHSDHLGSTVLVTNQGGTTHSSEGYYAYGRYRTGGIGLTDHKFTGQKRDGTGLMYYNARYYDPDLGQFLSPDTLVPDPGNVFAYNRYIYVAGNPMRLTDSSGHVWETIADVVSVGYDIYDIANNGLTWENGASLAVDAVSAVVPFVPSAGACVRWCDEAVQYGDEALEYGGKAVNYVGDKLDEGWQATKEAFGMGDETAEAANSRR